MQAPTDIRERTPRRGRCRPATRYANIRSCAGTTSRSSRRTQGRLPGFGDAVVRTLRRPGGARHPLPRGPARKSALNRVPAALADAVPLDDQPVPGLQPCLHVLLRPPDAQVPRLQRRARTSSARSSSRSTCRRCCGPSWRGRRGRASTSRSGTNTDPYQWVEGRYKLMRGIWEAMRDFANPCSILTKSPLLLRDLDLLREIAERTERRARACRCRRSTRRRGGRREPHTPHPRARLEAVAELNRAGIPHRRADRAADAGDQRRAGAGRADRRARRARPARPRSAGRRCTCAARCATIFFDWLREHRPDLVAALRAAVRQGAYLPPGDAASELAARPPRGAAVGGRSYRRSRGAAAPAPPPGAGGAAADGLF